MMSQRSIAGTLYSWLAVLSYASCKEESRLVHTLRESGPDFVVAIFHSFVFAPVTTISRAAETIGLLLVSLGSKQIVMSWIAHVLRDVGKSSTLFLQSLNRVGPCYDRSRKCKMSGNVRTVMKLFHDFVINLVHGKGGIDLDLVVKEGEYDDFSEGS